MAEAAASDRMGFASVEPLASALAELSNPTKDARAQYGTYTSLPALLDHVRPVLARHGLAVFQTPLSREGMVGVRTVILSSDGIVVETEPFLLPSGANAQTAGSAMTYARRYALCAVLGIAGDEDDDGREASKRRTSEGERAPSRGPSSSGSPSDDVAAERKGEQGRDNPGSSKGGDPARSLPAEDRADGGAESGEYGEGSPGSASSDRERLWRELKAAFGGQAKAIAAVNAAAGKNYTARTITDATSAEIAAALAQEVMG